LLPSPGEGTSCGSSLLSSARGRGAGGEGRFFSNTLLIRPSSSPPRVACGTTGGVGGRLEPRQRYADRTLRSGGPTWDGFRRVLRRSRRGDKACARQRRSLFVAQFTINVGSAGSRRRFCRTRRSAS